MSNTGDRLRTLVRVAAEDALFGVLALPDEPKKSLAAIEKRRTETYETAARGGQIVDASQLDLWLAAGTRALVGVGAPWFVPMRAAIDEGLSMERVGHGILARLAGNAPLERVRRVGAFAVRMARAVAASDGPPSAEEQRAIDLLLAALALPDDEARVLRAEPPVPIASIEVPSELELSLARAIVAGAWNVAASDGLDAAEHATLDAVARKLAIHDEAMNEMRKQAEQATQSQRKLGSAAVDAIRYIVAPVDPPHVASIVAASIEVSVPPIDRADATRLVSSGGATPLAHAHDDLERGARLVVLAAAWCVATSIDPSISRRARLSARHDRIAVDMKADRLAEEARAMIDDHLARALDRGVAAAGG
jgi:hypothetical protein